MTFLAYFTIGFEFELFLNTKFFCPKKYLNQFYTVVTINKLMTIN